ncbi:MAG: MFS transporter [Chloroflexi bacterium]|nr:MFS transporter [Chloroflexota bacterium]
MLLVLRNARFRLLWISLAINYVGLMTYITVHGWLALTVTDSAFWVGATAGVGGLGLMASSVVSGVLVDRLNRKKLIIAAQLAQASIALVMAALIFTGHVALWHVMMAAFLDGTFLAIKMPSRFALVLDVAGRENLLKATAANFAAMTMMGIAIPPLAGYIVEVHDVAWAYVMMSSAFVLSAVVLAFLSGVTRSARVRKASPLQDLTEGLRYAVSNPQVRALILLTLTSEVFGWAHETMLPVMAGKVLDAGPRGLGYLLSAGSAGALVSTLVLSGKGEIRNKGRVMTVGYVGFGFFLILFAQSPWLPLSMLLLAAAYASVAVYETTLSTLLQTAVPDEMRGRVLSLQSFTWGVTGASGFHTGAVAVLVGAPLAISIGGGALILNGLRMVRGLSRRFLEEQVQPAAGD